MNPNWTVPAREALNRFLAQHRAACATSGADPDEVTADLRGHIEAELVRAGVTLVTREDLERILLRLGPPPAAPAGAEPSFEIGGAGTPMKSAAPRKTARRLLRWLGSAAGLFFGVLLPLATLLIELSTHVCAGIFDPIPTWFHVLAIALVPAANAYAMFAVRKSNPARLRLAGRLNALALGITLFYALCFIPLTPFACLGILFFGIGLLPLSPLLSLLVGLVLRRTLRQRARLEAVTLRRVWTGLAAGFALLIVLELPGAFTTWAVRTIGDASDGSARAAQLLRIFGRESRLLRGCYESASSRGDTMDLRANVLNQLVGRVTESDYQLAYYRVTGRPYNSVPAPRRSTSLARMRGREDTAEWVWDESLGADRVGQRLKALYLTESKLDGHADGDAALGYLEWTLVFRNDNQSQQREARAVVQLPPGAVVSRVTLWINGEEREAAFGGGGEVRAAYQQVAVVQHRDPVLVTSHGPGQVLVQCFPIPPRGGEMKVRLGLTLPLVVDRPEAALFALPRLVEQNFSAAPGLTHALWIESQEPLATTLPGARNEPTPAHGHAVRAALAPAQLGAPESTLTVQRSPAAGVRRAVFPPIAEGVFTQEFRPRPAAAGALVIVLDGSRDLAPAAAALAAALEKFPVGERPRVFVAGEEIGTAPAGGPAAVAAWLRGRIFRGGQDSARALMVGFDAIAAQGNGTLLWLHGAQPATWAGGTELEQAFARRRGQIHLLAFAAVAGPNVLLDQLADSSDLAPLPRLGALADDLGRALRQVRGGDPMAVRTLLPAPTVAPAAATDLAAVFAGHLARLWAADEVTRLRNAGPAHRAEAVTLAVRAQLVTAVSGAVVLETQQQYDAAGLKPVDPATTPNVPGVPEPATVALLTGTAALLAVIGVRRRRAKEQRAAVAFGPALGRFRP